MHDTRAVSCDIPARKKQGRTVGLFSLTRKQSKQNSAPGSPAAPMPAMMPSMPAHFGGHLLRTVNRGGGAGVAQRKCPARSAGAASTSNAPTTASPRTFIMFICILLD